MMRVARSASSACTAIRSSLTAIGNGVRDMSDDTMVAMPCVSRSPRTTSASICEGVWKMTVRSLMSSSDGDPAGRDKCPIDLQQDHRHVVVLIGGANERLDLAHDALAELAGVEVAVLFDDSAEARFTKQIAVGIHRFGDAVGIEHDDVAGGKIDALFFEELREFFGSSVDSQSDHHAARRQHARRRY